MKLCINTTHVTVILMVTSVKQNPNAEVELIYKVQVYSALMEFFKIALIKTHRLLFSFYLKLFKILSSCRVYFLEKIQPLPHNNWLIVRRHLC